VGSDTNGESVISPNWDDASPPGAVQSSGLSVSRTPPGFQCWFRDCTSVVGGGELAGCRSCRIGTHGERKNGPNRRKELPCQHLDTLFRGVPGSEPPWGGSRRSNAPRGLKYSNVDSQRRLRRPRVRTVLILEELLLTLWPSIVPMKPFWLSHHHRSQIYPSADR